MSLFSLLDFWAAHAPHASCASLNSRPSYKATSIPQSMQQTNGSRLIDILEMLSESRTMLKFKPNSCVWAWLNGWRGAKNFDNGLWHHDDPFSKQTALYRTMLTSSALTIVAGIETRY